MSPFLGQILPGDDDRGPERMWPMDLALAALSGLVLYTVATRLRIDDPRPLYSAWTYFIGVPIIVVGLSLLLRSVTSRFVRRSMQLGFLASVLVHLLLVLAAFNVVIFSRYWSDATSGNQPIRAPIRKTVPDYLFTRSPLPYEQSDWSKPVDAATASRVMSQEEQRESPADDAAERLQMPAEQPRLETVEQPLQSSPRRQPSTMPEPSPSVPRLTRQDLRRAPRMDPSIEIPELSIAPAIEATAVARAIDEPARRAPAPTAAVELQMGAAARLSAALPELSSSSSPPPSRIERPIDGGSNRSQPQVGELATEFDQPSRRRRDVPQAPAGASPTSPALRIARQSPSAIDQLSDQLRDRGAPVGRQPAAAPGAVLQHASDADGAVDSAASSAGFAAPLVRVDPARTGGPQGVAGGDAMPKVAAIDLGRPADRRRKRGGPMPPAGSEITSVRPFERRTMRTSGGAAPTPAGTVGPQTEEAIERGLVYLAARQNRDGSWSLQGHGEDVLIRSDTAATGLCLLAFQGAGYTHQQHQYADTVAAGLNFLLRSQAANGDLYHREDAASNRNAWFYSHGISALALCEAYGMTRDPELRAPAQRAIDFIAATQHPQWGGWRYLPQASSDTSVTGWMMMALKSGELSGLNVPESTYDGIDHWLSVAQEGGTHGARYRYNPYAPDTPTQRHGRLVTPTMTAVGLLTRLYAGWTRANPNMQRGAAYVAENPPAIGTPRDPQRDTYYWYYATQLMFHMGGKYWEDWNGKLNPLLVSSQLREGADAGSWNPKLPIPDRWGPHAGRLYVTAMNLLSLEVYYRHLPIYEDTAK